MPASLPHTRNPLLQVESLLCLAALTGHETMAAAGQSGTLYKYEGRNVAVCVAGHEGPCLTLSLSKEQSKLLSGGADGKVKMWSQDLEPLATLDLFGLDLCIDKSVLSVCLSADGKKVGRTCQFA